MTTPEEALAYGRAVGEQTIEMLPELEDDLVALYETVDRLYDAMVENDVPAINVGAFIAQMVVYRTTGRVVGVESSQ